jgi:uncharacterized protein YodC (DUF2158 family)
MPGIAKQGVRLRQPITKPSGPAPKPPLSRSRCPACHAEYVAVHFCLVRNLQKDEPMSQDSLRVGDVVALKGGSPAMTVMALPADDRVKCGWFIVCVFMEGDFPTEALRKID